MNLSQIPISLFTESVPGLRKALEAEFRVIPGDGDLAQIRGAVVSASQEVSVELLERCPNLEIVAVYGVGLEQLDHRYLFARELVLAHTPGVLDETVAELALALMLTATRRVREADEFVRHGEWEERIFPLTRGLNKRRCGIAGLGRIGRKIAQRAEVFGLQISYFGRRHQDDVGYPYFDDLWALAVESDILVIALPGGSETAGMVNQEIIRALGPDGLLVNIGRGSIIDEEALIEALQFGDLGGAALDVFGDEPNVPEALRVLPNVVLTPHIGSATEDCRQAMLELTLANLRAHFSGRTVPGKVRLF